MRHITVGEGAPFGFAACRGAYDLAREDEERSAWLARRARIVTVEDRIDAVCETEGCGTQLSANARGTRCPRCLKREAMRTIRARNRRSPEPRKRLMVRCWVCGADVPKWGDDGRSPRPRKVCIACVPVAAANGPDIRDGHMTKETA